MAITTQCPSSLQTGEQNVNREDCVRYLHQEEYPLWDALVDVSPQGTVFCRAWWLNALPAEVKILGYFQQGRLTAGIPLYYESRFHIKLCCMPALIHAWGVVMEPLEGRRVKVNARQTEILTVFAARLKQERCFIQSFHPNLLNWLPFYWNGFRQTTRFTYLLDDISDLDRVWNEMDGNARRNIRKAESAGVTVAPCHSDLVYDMCEKTFNNQGLQLPFDRPYIQRLYNAALKADAGGCFVAQDTNGATHAAAFLAFDHKRAYYVVSGSDPELRASGAQSLVMWELLKFSSRRTREFDCAGSIIQPIEHFFRGFGGKLLPYNQIIKLPSIIKAGLAVIGRL